jgi:hypothetical protein
MNERTAEQEFEQVKVDIVNLLRAVENSLKEKFFATRVCDKSAFENIKCKIGRHPKTCLLIGGTMVLGLGILAAKVLRRND